MKGVASNVPVLPAGSASTAPPTGGGRQQQQAGSGADRRGGGEEDRGGGGGSGSSGRRTEAKRQRRQERDKHAVVLDEIAPKETGRQATLVSDRANECECAAAGGVVDEMRIIQKQ